MSDSLIIAFALSLCIIPIYFGVRSFLRGDHKCVVTPTMLLTDLLIKSKEIYADFRTVSRTDGLFCFWTEEKLCNINLDLLIDTAFDLVSDVMNKGVLSKKAKEKLILFSPEMMFSGLFDHDRVSEVVEYVDMIRARIKLQKKLGKEFKIKVF